LLTRKAVTPEEKCGGRTVAQLFPISDDSFLFLERPVVEEGPVEERTGEAASSKKK